MRHKAGGLGRLINMSVLKHWAGLDALFSQNSKPETIAFALGHVCATTKLDPSVVMPALQLMQKAAQKKNLSKLMVLQILQIMEEFPQQMKETTRVLQRFAEDKPIDFVYWVESHYNEINPNRNSPEAAQPKQQVNTEEEQKGQSEQPEAKDAYAKQIEHMIKQEEKRKAEEEERRNLEIARRMQEEWGQEAASNQEDVLCEICYVGLHEDEIESLDKCGHTLHKQCLAEAFKSNIMNNNFPLRCPVDQCGAEASENDLRAILAPNLFEKYQSHTLKSYADQHGGSVSWCPTPNCGYMFFYEQGDDVRFECLQCKKEYCLSCRVEWHKNMTCKEYKVSSSHSEDDQKFLEFVKGKKFKQCPRCKFWVEKNEGCDHMTCKCKFEFCYKCGGVYMKCECMEEARRQMERRRQQALERAQRRKEQRSEKARQQRQAKKEAKEAERLAKKQERERLKEEKEREKEEKKRERESRSRRGRR